MLAAPRAVSTLLDVVVSFVSRCVFMLWGVVRDLFRVKEAGVSLGKHHENNRRVEAEAVWEEAKVQINALQPVKSGISCRERAVAHTNFIHTELDH